MSTTITTADATSGGRGVGLARWYRLMPIAMVVYIISFMDRTNISYAFQGFAEDFHIDKAQQGFVAGVFFIGYVLFQIPGGHLAERWSAKKFVAIMIIAWGVFAVLCAFAQSFFQLVLFRFLLGVAEGGVWPAMLVLLSHWFPRRERARAYGFWMTNLAIASIITQPLSGFIISHTTWRLMFLIEGVLPFVIALPLWLLLVRDWPAEAPWLPEPEKSWLTEQIARDRAELGEHQVPFRTIFAEKTVWWLVLVYFLIQIGFYGLNLWLPTLLKNLTQQGFGAVGLIAALPYLCAIVILWANGWWADRTGRYGLHVFMAMVLASVSLVLSVLVGQSSVPLSVFFICLAMGGALGYDGPFWAAASTVLPVTVVGGAMGLINALGNLGGYLGPFVGGWLQDRSHGSFLTTGVFLAGALFLAGLVMLFIHTRGERPSGEVLIERH
jgi:sugar phosphate permease